MPPLPVALDTDRPVGQLLAEEGTLERTVEERHRAVGPLGQLAGRLPMRGGRRGPEAGS